MFRDSQKRLGVALFLLHIGPGPVVLQMTDLLLKRSKGDEKASVAHPHADFLSISNELQ